MFCGNLPCTCGGEPKKKARKAAAPKPAAKRTQPVKDDIDFGRIPEQVKPKFKTKVEAERDLSLESALRILRPICSEASQREIDQHLARTYPQEVDRRVAAWKESHGTAKPIRIKFKGDASEAD